MNITPGTVAGEYANYSIPAEYQSVLSGMDPDILGNYNSAQIEAKAAELIAAGGTAISMPSTGGGGVDGQTTLDNLALGYYMVVETKAPEGYVAGSPFFVAIPSTDNYNDPLNNPSEGTEWVYDITVTPKNSEVTFANHIVTKRNTAEANILAKSVSANIGETLLFVSETKVPNFSDDYFSGSGPIFKITDTMVSGLDYIGNISVYTVAADGITETQVTSDAATWTQDDAATEDLAVTFAKDFLETNGGKTIRIYYETKLKTDAVRGAQASGNLNQAVLSYSNDLQNILVPAAKNDKVRIFTFDIKIEKFAQIGGTNTGLAEAKFGLYTDAKCNTLAGITTATKDTNAGGFLQFDGVKAGTYYIKEMQSPKGYKLLANPIKVEIRADEPMTGEFALYIENSKVNTTVTDPGETFVSRFNNANGLSIIAVKNEKGFTLPATGGAGIAIFLIIGIVGLSILSMVMIKRKKA